MGSHIFRDFGGEKSLIYRDLKMGRFTVKICHCILRC